MWQPTLMDNNLLLLYLLSFSVHSYIPVLALSHALFVHSHISFISLSPRGILIIHVSLDDQMRSTA